MVNVKRRAGSKIYHIAGYHPVLFRLFFPYPNCSTTTRGAARSPSGTKVPTINVETSIIVVVFFPLDPSILDIFATQHDL